MTCPVVWNQLKVYYRISACRSCRCQGRLAKPARHFCLLSGLGNCWDLTDNVTATFITGHTGWGHFPPDQEAAPCVSPVCPVWKTELAPWCRGGESEAGALGCAVGAWSCPSLRGVLCLVCKPGMSGAGRCNEGKQEPLCSSGHSSREVTLSVG